MAFAVNSYEVDNFPLTLGAVGMPGRLTFDFMFPLILF